MPAPTPKGPLNATSRMASSLFERRVGAMLQALRCRVEADPACGQTPALNAAEHLHRAGQAEKAAAALSAIDDLLNARAARLRAQQDQDEAERLARARRETPERDQGGKISVLERDGLMWLKRKKRLSDAEAAAAETYRARFEKLFTGPAQSPYRETRASAGALRSAQPEIMAEAIWRLDELRDALGRDAALIWLMDEVAGKGSTLRDLAKGDQRAADRLEVELRVACRLLARRLGFKS